MKEHEHAAKNKPETKPAQDEVAKKAYAIYQKEGHQQGHAERNWLEAEAQLQHAAAAHPDHGDHHAHMAADFRKRFWISLVLILPNLILRLKPKNKHAEEEWWLELSIGIGDVKTEIKR